MMWNVNERGWLDQSTISICKVVVGKGAIFLDMSEERGGCQSFEGKNKGSAVISKNI